MLSIYLKALWIWLTWSAREREWLCHSSQRKEVKKLLQRPPWSHRWKEEILGACGAYDYPPDQRILDAEAKGYQYTTDESGQRVLRSLDGRHMISIRTPAA